MPTRSKHPCLSPGCGKLVESGFGSYCDEHKKPPRYNRRAKSPYNYRWQKVRASFLKENPLCAEHLLDGDTVAAVLVDHIVPHKGNQVLFWDRDNWQSLCKECHDRKTAKENDNLRARA